MKNFLIAQKQESKKVKKSINQRHLRFEALLEFPLESQPGCSVKTKFISSSSFSSFVHPFLRNNFFSLFNQQNEKKNFKSGSSDSSRTQQWLFWIIINFLFLPFFGFFLSFLFFAHLIRIAIGHMLPFLIDFLLLLPRISEKKNNFFGRQKMKPKVEKKKKFFCIIFEFFASILKILLQFLFFASFLNFLPQF